MSVTAAQPVEPTADINLLQLTRLLPRLEQRLSKSDNHSTRIELTRIGTDLEYAKSLLRRLDDTYSKSTPIRSNRMDLGEKRSTIKQLDARLRELNTHHDSDSSAAGSDSEDEDLLSTYAPAIGDIHGGLDITSNSNESPSDAQLRNAATALTSSLRARKQQDQPQARATTTSSSSNPQAPPSKPNLSTTPFAPKKQDPAAPTTDTAKLLEHHDAEQERITQDLASMAAKLSYEAKSFGASVTSSAPLVDNVVAALDKNVTGMESASSRMGKLRRMTEGKGWLARISLYAWVAALWVVAILIVFVLPKLRFSAAL